MLTSCHKSCALVFRTPAVKEPAVVPKSQPLRQSTSVEPQEIPSQVGGGDEICTEHSFASLNAADKSPITKGNWLLDSGCSRHMSGDRSLFNKLNSLERPVFVKFGDGKRLKAQGSGQVTTPIGILTAIYVPQLCANLLSVHQLNQDGASVSFHPQKAEICYAGQRFSVSTVGNIFQVDEASCFFATQNEYDLWHQKLGHLNFPAVIAFLKRFGITFDKPPSSFCRICAEAKLSESKFIHRELCSRDAIHSDIGDTSTRSNDGFRYWITFIHEGARLAKVFYLKRRSDAADRIVEAVKFFQNAKKFGIAVFRSDGGKEYESIKVQTFFRESGIEHEVAPRYTPQLNGIAERINRTLVERTRCLLVSSGLNDSFWKEAMEYSVYIYNRTPHSAIGFRTPWEVFYEQPLKRLPKFHVFGSLCYSHVPKELRMKLDSPGQKSLFLGFTNTAATVLTLPERIIKEVRTIAVEDGSFLSPEQLSQLGIGRNGQAAAFHPQTISHVGLNDEDQPTTFGAGMDVAEQNAEMEVDPAPEPVPQAEEMDLDLKEDVQPEAELNVDPPVDFLDVPNEGEAEEPVHSDEVEGDVETEGDLDENFDRTQGSPERRGISYVEDDIEWSPRFGKRHRYDEDDDDYIDSGTESDDSSFTAELLETQCFLSHVASYGRQAADCQVDQEVDSLLSSMIKELDCLHVGDAEDSSSEGAEPKTFEEAFRDPKWVKSMKEEMKSLLDNKTWILVDTPKGRKIVKNKWVFKQKSDGRLKSRLVAKGFTQVFGVDFNETWSPVGRKASLKLLIWLVLQKGWSWKQMDVDTAFLNSDLEEEIYMEQPRGFHDGTDRVCRLLKSIYGLKQASRSWYKTLREFLESLGLKASRTDPCIYLLPGVIIFVYVDDIIIAAESDQKVEELAEMFKGRFKMKDLGTPKRILGLDLVRVTEGVHLSGVDMIDALLKNFNMENCRPVSTPADPNQSLLPNQEKVSHEPERYSSAIGSLLYIASTFRPDISYAVSVLSQFTSNPSEDHWRGVKRVMRYLSGTRSFGILFRTRESSSPELRGFTDADFASCFTRRSRTGHIFFAGDSVISWNSRRQSVVSLSTCEAEYYALTEGGKEGIFLNRLFWEMMNQQPLPDDQILPPVLLHCDNQSTIFVTTNSADHKMLKHVDVRHKWIQERADNGDIRVEYVSTKEQVADIFTKGLTKELFEKFRAKCGIVKQSMPLERECQESSQ